jgi:hypothetical protein
MIELSPADILNVWESGLSLHPLDQGVLVIRAGLPEAAGDSVADWPLGRRNRTLAELRRACFGARLRGGTTCPHCAEPVEFELDSGKLIEAPAAEIEAVSVGGETFRLPTSRILAGVVDAPDPETAAARLCDRCRIGGDDREGEEPAFSSQDLERIGEAMASADPMAEVAFDFDCPACGAAFREDLDLAEFFWKEIEVEAKRLLFEVHTLASAYGWREHEVLALSSARRAYYLERALE